jgi:hypothetical protein
MYVLRKWVKDFRVLELSEVYLNKAMSGETDKMQAA